MFKSNNLLAAFLVLLFAMPALANSQDGSFFLQACGATIKQADGGNITADETSASIYCIGYVAGFLDAYSVGTSFSKNEKIICTPKQGITNDQGIRIFVKYLRENPKVLHESGRMSLFVALAKTFPC